MMSKYMQVIWLYLIGIAVIMVGLIMLSMNSGPSSFIFMLMGLAIAAIGAAHGRKMRMMGQLDMGQVMQQKAGQEQVQEEGGTGEEAQEEATEGVAAGQEALNAEPQPDDQDYVPPQKAMNLNIGSRIGSFMGALRGKGFEPPLEQEDIFNIEMEDIKKGKIAATRADVIMLVCPKCGSENQEKNVYCYDCGNKLQKKASELGGKQAEIRVEPGSISIVDDRRVAKVVICPKCNSANKVGDKFCFSCGKKILSDSSVLKKMEKTVAKEEEAEPEKVVAAPSKKPKSAAKKAAKRKSAKLSDLDKLFADEEKKVKAAVKKAK